jgi:glycosyltransferase involved in cell wall biosynthesis
VGREDTGHCWRGRGHGIGRRALDRADDSLSGLDARALTFDLVVATLGRAGELDSLLASLEQQTHKTVRVIVVDQNEDDRAAAVLDRHPGVNALRLRSAPGLSRARNVALPQLSADIVAFPDDDCSYPPDLLERVADRFAERPDLDGLTGRAADADGTGSPRWPSVASPVTRTTVWNRVNSHTLFLRRDVVARTGLFDESLGLGSGRRWHSGEETDFVVGALRAGARIEYDPSFVVVHPYRRPAAADLRALGARDGASVGYILRKRGYPPRAVARMLVRPLGGALAALARADLDRARFHLATFAGRVRGYLGFRTGR